MAIWIEKGLIFSTVGGGHQCATTDSFAVVCGGEYSYATGKWSTVCGGFDDSVAGDFSAILGGDNNSILGSADSSVILGGSIKQVSGVASAILGGCKNTVVEEFSMAFGNGVTVDSSYVTAFYNSTNPGKVGINEPNPEVEFQVNGTVKISEVLRLEPLPSEPDGDMGYIYVKNDGTLWFHNGSEWKQVELSD